MKRLYQFLLLVAFSVNSFSQEVRDTILPPLIIKTNKHFDTSTEVIDTTTKRATETARFHNSDGLHKIYPYNKKRVKLVATANVVGYGAGLAGLYSAWYSNYPQTRFHFFNDNAEWLQVDKVGHTFSAYAQSYASMELWRWTGIERKKRIWLGGLSGVAYQTVIEILDGFSAGWGWSWGDFAANMAGSGLLISQELGWDEQRVRLKYSFHQKDYGSEQLNKRADELYGSGLHQRFIKDYNGQTYWLSVNLKSFMPESNLPAWLNVAAGYGADGMFGGRQNIWKGANGTSVDRTDIQRYRQWYVAPDVDLTKIKTNSKPLKFALGVLNVLKFPAPSLEFSQNKVRWNWMHF